MNENQTNEFLAEGMKRYKPASEVMQKFYKDTQEILQNILLARKNWGKFTPHPVKQGRSWRYWDDYPYIDAIIQGHYEKRPLRIKIGINWYDSKGDYPFYEIHFYEKGEHNKALDDYEPKREVVKHNEKDKVQYRYYPDPESYNLERDFKILIDEFVNAISKSNRPI